MDSNEKYICDNLDLFSLSEIDDFSLHVQIETTVRCNSKCQMCPHSREMHERRTFDMSKDLMDKLAEELSHYAGHLRRVIPQGFGEPLLDPNIFHFIARLKKAGIKEVFISSNGSLLNEEKANALLESGLDQIDFSVDAINKETYEKIRIGLDYHTVMNNIENFIKMRDKRGAKTRVRFRYVIQKGINDKEFDDFCSYWKTRLNKEDAISGKKVHTFGGNVKMPDLKEYSELKEKLWSLPCKGIFGSLIILCDGTVMVCGVDVNQKYIAGDVNKNTIQEIWKGEVFTEFRKKHLELGRAAYPHCRNCNSWAPELKLAEV
ncbi:MAG: hypothetical protein CMN79_04890 [Spirochaetales bacterium]|nr:hypothetical protein [Spirochaetales bacterium]